MRPKSLAVLLAATPLLTLLAGTAPAHAAVCGSAQHFTTVATRPLGNSGQWEWWYTETAGTVRIELIAQNPDGAQFVAYGDSCGSLCGSSTSCTVTNNGHLTIAVKPESGPYHLVVTSVEPVLPTADRSCNLVDSLSVCADARTGDLVRRVSVTGANTAPGRTHTVVGRVDQYRFSLPTGGSVVLPCVVLTVNGTGSTGCATAGGTYVGTTMTLLDGPVQVPTVALDDPIASVGVCESTVTLTVGGFGAEEFPALTLC